MNKSKLMHLHAYFVLVWYMGLKAFYIVYVYHQSSAFQLHPTVKTLSYYSALPLQALHIC